MSKKRVQSSRRRARGTVKRAQKGDSLPSWLQAAPLGGWPTKGSSPGLKVHHFAGISLAGGKTDKTCLALLDYYPAQNKIFLSRLFEKIRSDETTSADLHLHRMLTQSPGKLESVAFDVPLKFPKCVTCRLKCPGYEECTEPEIEWMWKHYKKINARRKPKRLFTPYTERCVEMYLATEIEEAFHLPHALGSNVAPLTARAHFVSRRISVPTVEVYPKLSIWRIGRALHLARSHLLFHKHSIGGDESRKHFLHRLVEKNIAFIYEQDTKTMIENNQAFEAFVTALTAVLDFRGECESRPKDFPKKESWMAIPKASLKL